MITPEFRQVWQGKADAQHGRQGHSDIRPGSGVPRRRSWIHPKALPKVGPIPESRDPAFRENLDGLYKGMKGRGLRAVSISSGHRILRRQRGSWRWHRLEPPPDRRYGHGGGLLDHMKMELPKAGEEAGVPSPTAPVPDCWTGRRKAGSAFGRAAADAFNGAIRGIQSTFISPPENAGVNADVGRPRSVTPPAALATRRLDLKNITVQKFSASHKKVRGCGPFLVAV